MPTSTILLHSLYHCLTTKSFTDKEYFTVPSESLLHYLTRPSQHVFSWHHMMLHDLPCDAWIAPYYSQHYVIQIASGLLLKKKKAVLNVHQNTLFASVASISFPQSWWYCFILTCMIHSVRALLGIITMQVIHLREDILHKLSREVLSLFFIAHFLAVKRHVRVRRGWKVDATFGPVCGSPPLPIFAKLFRKHAPLCGEQQGQHWVQLRPASQKLGDMEITVGVGRDS